MRSAQKGQKTKDKQAEKQGQGELETVERQGCQRIIVGTYWRGFSEIKEAEWINRVLKNSTCWNSTYTYIHAHISEKIWDSKLCLNLKINNKIIKMLEKKLIKKN